MPKFLLFLLMLSLSLPGFTQGEGGKVIYRDSAPQAASPEVAPAAPVAPTNDDAAVAELEAAKKAQLEKITKIKETTEAIKPLNPIEEIQKLGHKQINAAAMMDPKVLEIIQKVLKEGVLSKVPREEVKKMLKEKLTGTFIGRLTEKYPVLLEIFVDIVRDPIALPGLVHILQRRDDLKTYGYLWIGIFLFGLWIKSRLIKPKWKFTKRLSYSLPISIILTSATLYLFYSMFQVELDPSLRIIFNHI